MSRAEAAATDPQQRLFLACCAESLETAGYRATPALNSDNGLQIGVFCAVETSDYAVLQQHKPSPYTGTGSHTAVAPNRVSAAPECRERCAVARNVDEKQQSEGLYPHRVNGRRG